MNQEDSEDGDLALGGLAPIVNELARAMPAALLYPAEHRRFAELAEPMLKSIGELAGAGGSFVLEVHEAGLWVMGSELPEDTAGASELRDVLTSIGVSRVEVDAGARKRDLHALLGRLAQGKRRVDVVGEVRDLNLDDLPPTVRARTREFGRRVVVGESKQAPGLKLSLGATGASGAAITTAVTTATAGAAASPVLRLDDQGEAPRPRILPRRENHQAPAPTAAAEPDEEPHGGPKLILHGKANERALAAAAQSSVETAESEPPQNEDAPAVEETGGASEGKSAQERRELYEALAEGVELLDVLLGPLDSEEAAAANEGTLDKLLGERPESDQEPTAEVSTPEVRGPGAPDNEREEGGAEQLSLEADGCELSIDELRERIDANARRAEPLTHVDVKDHTEELSILLHVLISTSDPATRRGLGVSLNRVLSEGAAGQEREIVHAALQELVCMGDGAQVDATLPLVLAPLRRSRVESIGGLLLELLRDGPAEAVGLLWPHIANEVLLGVKHEEPETAKAMYELIGRIPVELLRAGLVRLAALEALRSGRVSEDLLDEPSRAVARLLAELIESGVSDEIGPVLLKAFQSRQPARAAEIALTGFGTCVPSCRRLLVALLRDLGRGRQGRGANDVAGRILVESIERLAPHQREEPAVLEAIAALGGMRHRPARSVLHQIVRERKAVLIPAWPAPAREAAQRALKTLGVD